MANEPSLYHCFTELLCCYFVLVERLALADPIYIYLGARLGLLDVASRQRIRHARHWRAFEMTAQRHTAHGPPAKFAHQNPANRATLGDPARAAGASPGLGGTQAPANGQKRP